MILNHLGLFCAYFYGSVLFVGVTTQFCAEKRHKITLIYILELSKNQYMNGDLCYMNNNMIIPGLKDVIIHEIKEYLDRVAIHVSY